MRSREGLAALFVVYLRLASCAHTSGGAGVVSQIREDGRSRPSSRDCRVWNKEGGRGREGRGRGKGEDPAWWWFVHRVAIARQNPGGPFGYVMYQPNSNPARRWGDLAGVDVLSARVLCPAWYYWTVVPLSSRQLR
ncbi:hypothetical protein OIDMADRAFT_142345 [Oidiodendron maius Zn]|uniref:Secreted protein n=1 Tax=Oidiodendron maius (strain Zn) TaxID=913774 RepID=A0A0C3CZL1_OIDMZ|nr:hypothetical protein OIDMADRAFT_142345 [Oidiodendron maius Zn]